MRGAPKSVLGRQGTFREQSVRKSNAEDKPRGYVRMIQLMYCLISVVSGPMPSVRKM